MNKKKSFSNFFFNLSQSKIRRFYSVYNKKGQQISYSFNRSCNHFAEIIKFTIEELATNLCKLVLPEITSRTSTDKYLGKAINDKVFTIKYDELKKNYIRQELIENPMIQYDDA